MSNRNAQLRKRHINSNKDSRDNKLTPAQFTLAESTPGPLDANQSNPTSREAITSFEVITIDSAKAGSVKMSFTCQRCAKSTHANCKSVGCQAESHTAEASHTVPEAGHTVVEAVVACALLVSVLLPALGLLAHMATRHSQNDFVVALAIAQHEIEDVLRSCDADKNYESPHVHCSRLYAKPVVEERHLSLRVLSPSFFSDEMGRAWSEDAPGTGREWTVRRSLRRRGALVLITVEVSRKGKGGRTLEPDQRPLASLMTARIWRSNV